MDASPGRATFQALPLELKNRIVELARRQDEAFTARRNEATAPQTKAMDQLRL